MMSKNETWHAVDDPTRKKLFATFIQQIS